MWFYILAIMVFFLVTYTKEKPLSYAPSQDVYTQMVDNGEDGDTIRAYLEMESALIQETDPARAIALSTEIKETFPDYDFGHHTTMIKFIAASSGAPYIASPSG